MNTLSMIIIAIELWFVLMIVLWDWMKVKAKYKVHHNGHRWVVRDDKGRFVLVSKSFWDVLSLGTYDL